MADTQVDSLQEFGVLVLAGIAAAFAVWLWDKTFGPVVSSTVTSITSGRRAA